MRRFTLLFVPLCLLAGLVAGCSGSSLRGDDDAREQEIQALKARILQLQQEAAMNQVEVAQLRQKVAELDARNGGNRPPAKPPASSALAPSPVQQPAARPEPVKLQASRPAVVQPSVQPTAIAAQPPAPRRVPHGCARRDRRHRP